MRISLVLSIVLSCAAISEGAQKPIDWNNYVKNAQFDWIDGRADLFYSLQSLPSGFTVQITYQSDNKYFFKITFMRDGDRLLEFTGHKGTALCVNGNVLYYTDFNRTSTGCALVAFDLAKKKQLWKTRLKGVGGISHSRYVNSVILHPPWRGGIIVKGRESFGDYIEIVDLGSGRSLVNRLFRKDYAPIDGK